MPSIAPSTPPVPLTEDQIDDLLYLSRTNESTELLSEIASIKSCLLASTPGITEAGIVLSAIDPSTGNNILHMAAANGHTSILTSLIQTYLSPPSPTIPHPSLSHKNRSGNTPLHWACLNGHLGAVKVLVEVGKADPGVVNDAGKDAVFEAEIAGHAEVVEWLLRTCAGLEGGLGGGSSAEGEKVGEEEGEGKGKERMDVG